VAKVQNLNGFPIERKKLAELTKAPYNPRKITPEQAKALQRSLTEFGTVEPIIWNKQTGHIVGGHQRLDALQSLGETDTDVLIVDMPEEREQALNIALNKISGDWDNGMLSDVLLSMHDELRELAGFSEDEIKSLMNQFSIPDDNKDIDEEAFKDTKHECPSCGFKW
jgi:ParB-like chromosome segregation protein Spo0J